MARANGRQVRCLCGKRLLDVTSLAGAVRMEIKCKCGKLVEATVTADQNNVKEVGAPALV